MHSDSRATVAPPLRSGSSRSQGSPQTCSGRSPHFWTTRISVSRTLHNLQYFLYAGLKESWPKYVHLSIWSKTFLRKTNKTTTFSCNRVIGTRVLSPPWTTIKLAKYLATYTQGTRTRLYRPSKKKQLSGSLRLYRDFCDCRAGRHRKSCLSQ